MESAQTKISITTRVFDLRERTKPVYQGGTGSEALFKDVSLGWFAVFQGSHEALYVGETKPDWDVGDNVKITFERVSKYAIS